MKLDYLKERQELISTVLLGASVFFCVLIFIKLVGYSVASARAERFVRTAVGEGVSDANAVKEHVAKAKEVADAMKKKNLFAPPPAKKHPVKEVRGIAGDRVLIGGEWHELGASVGEAKIVAIEPTYVKIEWEGKTKVFAPISAADSSEEKTERGAKEGRARSEVESRRGEVGEVSSEDGEEGRKRGEEHIRMLRESREARRREQ
jgi:hypothetical protein